MTEKETVQVDVEKIMEEIREEVRRNGPYERIPSFDDIPVPQEEAEGPVSSLRMFVAERTADLTIPPVFPLEETNPLKRFYKRLASKLVRCATFPLSQRVTETNVRQKECLEAMAQTIEKQQFEIEELKRITNRLMRQLNDR